MEPDFKNMDLYCRINVHAEVPFREFVALIARHADGSGFMNEVQSGTLDISIHKNDTFDFLKSHTGHDRWLYFRYTLEINPIAGVSPRDYALAIGRLLKSLWSSGMDGVASCDFEDQLPRNVRRLKWAWNPRNHGTPAGESQAISGTNIVIPPSGDPIVVLDAWARIVRMYWIQARFEDPATGKKYRSYEEIPFGCVDELLAYRNSEAEAAWDLGSSDAPLNSMLHLIRCSQSVKAVMDDPETADMATMLRSISDMSNRLDTYPEAA